MYYAIKKDGERISSFEAKKGTNYFCPVCSEPVYLRRGESNIDHFAHVSLKDCDSFTHDMSEWHRKWQEKFPAENREVVIKAKVNNNKCVHRADVCIGKYVIEFQHSKITKEEFNKRNIFYAQSEYNVIWVFDLREENKNGQICCYDEWSKNGDNGGKWKWSYPPKFLSDISPHRNKKIRLIFQIDDEKEDYGYLELVTWAPDSRINWNLTDYSRFFTSYRIMNFEDLYREIINGTI